MKNTKDISWDIIAIFAGLAFGIYLASRRKLVDQGVRGPATAFGVRG